MEVEERLIIGITMGDPASIGPGIAIKTLFLEEIYHKCRPLVIGDINVMETAARTVGEDGVKIHPVHSVDEALFEPGTMDVYNMGLVSMDQLEWGKVSTMIGEAVFRYVEKMIQMALAGEVSGTVTNTFNEGTINLTGYHYSGRTGVYADMTGTKKYIIILAHENMRVMHVSTRVSLREACEWVKKDRVPEVARIAYQACRNLGIQQSKIGITGFNPHNGEDGPFGGGEIGEIISAIETASGERIFAEGPVPPDTAFSKTGGGWYDMVAAMYHSQGHAPPKVVGFVHNQEQQKWNAAADVNITLGLPIVRASVDHGTALDQASQGAADELGLMSAIDCGIRSSRGSKEKTVKKQ